MAVMLSMGKPLSSAAPEFKPLSWAAPEFKPLSSEAPVFKPSMDAPEFVPGGLSAKVVEFVPTWARPTGFASRAPVPICIGHAGNMFMLDMDQYSDFSEDEPSCTTKDLDEPPSEEVDMPNSQTKLPPWKRFPTVEAENKLAAAEGHAMTWRAQDISEPEQEECVASQAEGAVEQSVITPKLTQGSECVCESSLSNFATDIAKVESELEDDLEEKESVEEPDAEQSTDEIEATLASDSEGNPDDSSSGLSATFSVDQMLLWRAAAMDLTDPHVVYSATADPTLSAPSKPRGGTKKGGRAPSSPDTWRGQTQDVRKGKPCAEEGSKVKQADKLERSGSSWLEQQRLRRSSAQSELGDEDIVRAMKSILNKLTIEKYSQLFSQMITCGIKTVTHVELLIEEVFEKAITQHHFIEMYADLCAHLHEHFIENPIVTDDPKKNFKKVLLNACQASFERNLTPPQGLGSLEEEERVLAEIKYKTRMLGNIRFVGALLTRKMLASKVLLAIMDELLGDPTPEALESLAALLTVVGPTFDGPAWSYHVALNAIFEQVKKMVKKHSTEPRVRCLLKDVLDLRAAGWTDRKPKKIDGPTTLDAVAQKQAQEEGSPMPQKHASASVSYDGWEQVPARGGRTPLAAVPKEKAFPPVLKDKFAKSDSKSGSRAKARFDRQEYRVEVDKTLQELRVSHDVKEATARLAEVVPPLDEQATELCDLLGRIAEEGSADVRKTGFEVIANLFLKGHWKSEIKSGLRVFISETCLDLKCDVPNLSNVLQDELHPALLQLVKRGLLSASKHDKLLQDI